MPYPSSIIVDIDSTIADTTRRRYLSLVDAGLKHLTYRDIENRSLGDVSSRLSRENRRRFGRIFYSSTYVATDIPIQGSAQALRILQKKFNIVYLTGRCKNPNDESLSMELPTISWLDGHEYPVPNNDTVWLFMRNHRGRRDDTFKRGAMKDVLAEELNPVVGVGDLPEDAILYLSFKLRTLILTSRRHKRPRYPSGTTFFSDWKVVPDTLSDL